MGLGMKTERQEMRGGLRERERLSLHLLLTIHLRFCEHAGASESAGSLERRRRRRRRKQKTDCSFVQPISYSLCSSSATKLTRHVSPLVHSLTRSFARSHTPPPPLSSVRAFSRSLTLALSRASLSSSRSLPLALALSLCRSFCLARSLPSIPP